MRSLQGIWLGRRRYAPVHALQERLMAARKAAAVSDLVLFVEHEPVITLGRGAHPEHILLPTAELAARGIDHAETGRGGDVTVHAPGQLVAYPLFDLNPDRCDVRRYVRDLAEVMSRVVRHFGVGAGTVDRYIGLWVDRAAPAQWPGAEQARELAKVGAIGVRVSRWVTMHGFALNLTTDLSLFRTIVPCGIQKHGVTSVQDLTGLTPTVQHGAELALREFGTVFAAEVQGLIPVEDWFAGVRGAEARDDQLVLKGRAP